MPSDDLLKKELTEALVHLHDNTLSPSAFLRVIVGAPPDSSAAAVQARILAWIEELRPDPTTPADSRAHREYDLLWYRYVLGLTQEDTAERMRMGVRTVQRLQSQAVHALAVRIWQGYQQRLEADSGIVGHPEGTHAEASDWQTQARQELASLSATDPDAVSDVGGVIVDVLHDDQILSRAIGRSIEIGFVQAGLQATIHPIALRQIIIAALHRLAHYVTGDAITIYARSEEGKARITLTGAVAAKELLPKDDLFEDMVAPDSVSLDLHRESDMVFLSIWLPTMGVVTVLVVDDNADMVQFYRRCTAGTRYHILHASTAQAMFDMLEQSQPDVLVLDVMLPDEDGWQVLMRLHENPETRSIPVVMLTVVREEELAMSLGAAAYLTKPVHPRSFVETLDALVGED